MPKVACYSAVYGNYDRPRRAPQTTYPCYMFTDSRRTAELAEAVGWIPRYVPHSVATLNSPPHITEPMLSHKYWKMHPAEACPDADISLWLDGSMEVCVPDYVERCLEYLGPDDWSGVKHPTRGCIYDEQSFSATLARYDGPSMLYQVNQYAAAGHPKNWGLTASGANCRRHTPNVLEMSHEWWMHNILYSHQDQLSLAYLMRVYGSMITFNHNMPWHTEWVLHAHVPAEEQ